MTGNKKSTLPLLALGIALQLLCARSDPIEPKGSPDVQPLGDPVKRTLSIGNYIVPQSFGGMEYIIVDPSKNYDPAYIEQLWEVSAKGTIHYAIYRYADFLWEGLVKNSGDLAADSVYVRISFAGGFVDSAYVSGFRVDPNQTAGYQLYSRGDRVDTIEVLWKESPEETS